MKKIVLFFALYSVLSVAANDYEIKQVPIEKIEPVKKINAKETFTKAFLTKQLEIESGLRHIVDGRIIRSKAGALGIAQFMPSTWRWLRRKEIIPKYFDITNKQHQKEAQKLYMEYLYSLDYGINDDKMALAAAAYNAGPARVKRVVERYGINWKYHLPKETKKYLLKLKLS